MESRAVNSACPARTEEEILQSIRSKLGGNRIRSANQSPAADGDEIPRLLESIRQKLTPDHPPNQTTLESTARVAASSAEVTRIQAELETALIAHRQFGQLQPPLSGVHHSAIRLVKKIMRRSLAWYTRPLHQFQSAILRSLQHVSTALRNQDDGLRTIQAKLDGSSSAHEQQIAALQRDIASLQAELHATKEELREAVTRRVQEGGSART